MNSPNPHSACYSLLVLESIVKNCGAPVHEEVFTKENCEMFSSFLEQTPHENVRQKMLELVQTWAYAFRSSDKYQAIKVSRNILWFRYFSCFYPPSTYWQSIKLVLGVSISFPRSLGLSEKYKIIKCLRSSMICGPRSLFSWDKYKVIKGRKGLSNLKAPYTAGSSLSFSHKHHII